MVGRVSYGLTFATIVLGATMVALAQRLLGAERAERDVASPS